MKEEAPVAGYFPDAEETDAHAPVVGEVLVAVVLEVEVPMPKDGPIKVKEPYAPVI